MAEEKRFAAEAELKKQELAAARSSKASRELKELAAKNAEGIRIRTKKEEETLNKDIKSLPRRHNKIHHNQKLYILYTKL